MFRHIGFNAFQEVERGGGSLDPAAIATVRLDAWQWVESGELTYQLLEG